MNELKELDLNKIKVSSKYLRINSRVDDLIESIQNIGIINPLIVNKKYELLAGGRRYAALKKLEYKKAPVVVIDKTTLQEELVSIDENIIRSDLNTIEMEEALSRRKIIYEEMHPQTKNGGDRGNQHTGGKSGSSTNSGSGADRFTKDAAERLGTSEESIRRGINRAEKSSDKVKDARKSGELGVSQTDELIKLDKKDQEKLLPHVKGKDVSEVKDIVKKAKEKGVKEAIEESKIVDDAKKFFKDLTKTLERTNRLLVTGLSDGIVFKGLEDSLEIKRIMNACHRSLGKFIELQRG